MEIDGDGDGDCDCNGDCDGDGDGRRRQVSSQPSVKCAFFAGRKRTKKSNTQKRRRTRRRRLVLNLNKRSLIALQDCTPTALGTGMRCSKIRESPQSQDAKHSLQFEIERRREMKEERTLKMELSGCGKRRAHAVARFNRRQLNSHSNRWQAAVPRQRCSVNIRQQLLCISIFPTHFLTYVNRHMDWRRRLFQGLLLHSQYLQCRQSSPAPATLLRMLLFQIAFLFSGG